jgi:hypothetical protein
LLLVCFFQIGFTLTLPGLASNLIFLSLPPEQMGLQAWTTTPSHVTLLAIGFLQDLASACISDLIPHCLPLLPVLCPHKPPFSFSYSSMSYFLSLCFSFHSFVCPCSSEAQLSQAVNSMSSGSSLPALSLFSFVTTGKLFNLSVLWCPYLGVKEGW